jgi:GNAT superfamily N-acetyltransferase
LQHRVKSPSREWHVRPAALADAAAIALVHLASRRSTYRRLLPDSELADGDAAVERFTREWRERLPDDGGRRIALVLEDPGGEVVGFVTAGWNGTGASFPCEIFSIYLESAAQRRGGGRRLFEAVMARLRAQQAPSLAVWVLERNPGRAFYTALGGMIAGRRTLTLGGAEVEEVAYLWMLDRPTEAPGANGAPDGI